MNAAMQETTTRPAPVLTLSIVTYNSEKWLPAFKKDNRSYLTVAIGCTGGQHRSVFMVERLAAHFHNTARILVRHRELD